MEILNRVDQTTYTSIEITLASCYVAENVNCKGQNDQETYFKGKQLMLLLNTQRVDFSQEKIESADDALV
jgi:hypothetical protein